MRKTLMVFAELAPYVWPDENLADLQTLFPNGFSPQMQICVLPKGEHMLDKVPVTDIMSWDDLKDAAKYPYSASLHDYIVQWISDPVASTKP